MAFVVVGTSALGYYSGARARLLARRDDSLGRLDGGPAAIHRWASRRSGAVVGLGFGLVRPRSRRAPICRRHGTADRAAAGAGGPDRVRGHRPTVRAVRVLRPAAPLPRVLLTRRAERGARPLPPGSRARTRRRRRGDSFSTLALDPFAFDSPTLSAVETAGRWATPGDAAVLFAAAGVAAAVAAVLLRRRPALIVGLSIGLSFLVGIAAYSGDRANDGADTRLARSGGARLARADRHPGGRCPGAARRLAPLGLDPRELEPERGPDLPPRRRPERPAAVHEHGPPARRLARGSRRRRPQRVPRGRLRRNTGRAGRPCDRPTAAEPHPLPHRRARSLPLRRLRRPPRRLGRFDRPLCSLPARASGAYRVVLSLPSGRVARQVRLKQGPSGVASTSRPEPRRPSRSRSRDTPFRSSPSRSTAPISSAPRPPTRGSWPPGSNTSSSSRKPVQETSETCR